jgi:hypothetical protein
LLEYSENCDCYYILRLLRLLNRHVAFWKTLDVQTYPLSVKMWFPFKVFGTQFHIYFSQFCLHSSVLYFLCTYIKKWLLKKCTQLFAGIHSRKLDIFNVLYLISIPRDSTHALGIHVEGDPCVLFVCILEAFWNITVSQKSNTFIL